MEILFKGIVHSTMRHFRISFFLHFALISFCFSAPDCSFIKRIGYQTGIIKPETIRYATGIQVQPVFGSDFYRVDSIKLIDEYGHEVRYERTNRSLEEIEQLKLYAPKHTDLKRLKGLDVLDIGTGNGQCVEDLIKNGINAKGIDVYLTDQQRKKPYFRAGDIRDSGYPSNSFDRIFATETMLSYPDSAAASRRGIYLRSVLKEISRILKPGGKIVISSFPPRYWFENGRVVTDYSGIESLLEGTGLKVSDHPKEFDSAHSVARAWIELERSP